MPIRPTHPTEAQELALLGERLWRETYTGLIPDSNLELHLEVARFYVDQTQHGTGAAQRLMAAVLAHATVAGHDGVWLQVWEQNPRAIRFYAKVGFQDAGDASYRIGLQVDRDRLMVHTLMSLGL